MEELFELRSYIEQGHYSKALALVGEMEEMSKDDKINKIRSLTIVLLLHLIKKHAEQRTTRSWELSIRNSIREINYTNKRRKTGGYYLTEEELLQAIENAYKAALDNASFEAFEGSLSESELAQKIDEEQIKQEALEMILKSQE